MCTKPPFLPQRGVSLIELIMFIVIVSVSLTGILLVMNVTTRTSADPLVHKQALAIAEALLEEVELMPFTICDPDDPNAASAVAAADCTGGAGGPNDESAVIGPEGAGSVGGLESRTGAAPFDNVSDYAGFGMPAGGILDIAGNGGAPAGYTVAVAVVPLALGVVPPAASLHITVTVDHAACEAHPCITLDGYRTRYSPRGVP